MVLGRLRRFPNPKNNRFPVDDHEAPRHRHLGEGAQREHERADHDAAPTRGRGAEPTT
jgi:hypothetical protein